MGLGVFRRAADLTTARSCANVLSPQDPEGFYKHLETLTQDLQAFRDLNTYSQQYTQLILIYFILLRI